MMRETSRPIAGDPGYPAASPPADTARQQGWARLGLALALILLGAWTLHRFIPALIWAAILAIALWPVYARAERRWPPGKHNILLPTLFTLAVALVLLLPLILVAFEIGHEARGLMHLVEEARQHGIAVPDWVSRLPFGQDQVRAWWETNLQDPGGYSELTGRLNREQLVGYSRQLGAQVIHRAILFGFSLLTLFFLFRQGHDVVRQLERAGSRTVGPHGERIVRQMVASVHGTVDGLVLVGLAEGVILGVAYFFTGVPHPAILGGLTAVAAMIPFVAPVIIAIAVGLLFVAGSVGSAIFIAILGTVVVFSADHFVRPALIGGATKLPFIWVLLGILGGVENWGLLGLFLGPALMAALIQLWRDWTERRRQPAEA